MTNTQKITLGLSEVRQRLNAIAGLEGDAFTDEIRTESEKLQREYGDLETRQRSAIIADGETATRAATDGEGTEIRQLVQRASLGAFLHGVARERAVDGSEAELRAALNLEGDQIPIDVLMPPRVEERADAATNVAASVAETQQSIAGRIFSQTAGGYMGVDRPTVAVGESIYATLSTGATADFRSDGVAKDAKAATFTTKTVAPSRVTARYLFSMESTVRLRGMEEGLRADLAATLGDKLDAVALTWQAAVADTSPEVEGIINQLTAPTDPSIISTWTDYVLAYSDRVDCKYSADGSNVRLLVHPDAYKLAALLQVNVSGELVLNTLPRGRFRASANMPASVSDVSRAITYAAGPRRGYVQPVWRALTAIRDPYTKAAEGQVALTVVMLTGVAMVDAGPYALTGFKLV